MEQILQSLEQGRLELLDMGIRGNTLLHLRPSAKTIEVVEEHSSDIYGLLVEKNRTMTFAPIPKALEKKEEKIEGQESLPPLESYLEEKLGDSRFTDTKLQTKLNRAALDQKLLKISTEALTFEQDQGINVLYLSLGFLNWKEDKSSSQPRRAPLVLIPVVLERSSAKERFALTYNGSDLSENLTLSAKMKMEFRINLPKFDDEFNIEFYFTAVKKQIEDQPNWFVDENEISLGFFSFGKFQMYQDLDSQNWPDDKKPEFHPVLSALLGGGFATSKSGEKGAESLEINYETPLEKLCMVLDADSSQTEAVLAAKANHNLVIQGPPGTGKSQTITNIISEALSDGKRILFVAEKMAALEVVKNRLDQTYLGDYVLELHSHKSNKKMVLEELKRTLELGAPQASDRSLHREQYQKISQTLNNYSKQINQKILNSGLTYVNALGLYLKLKEQTENQSLPEIDFEPCMQWNMTEFTEACNHITELVAHLEEMGVPEKSPFSTSKIISFSPIEQKQLEELISNTESVLQQTIIQSSELSKILFLTEPDCLSDIETLFKAAQRATEAPHLEGLKLTTGDWQVRRDQIKSLLLAGKDASEIKAKWQEQLIDQVWSADLIQIRATWASVGNKWWRFLSSDYRQAKRTLQGFLRVQLPQNPNETLELIDDVLNYQTYYADYQKHKDLGQVLFGAQWQGLESDWQVLKNLTQWIVELYEQIGSGELPQGLIQFLEGGANLKQISDKLNNLESIYDKTSKNIEVLLAKLSIENGAPPFFREEQLFKVASDLSTWRNYINDLHLMARYNRLINSLDDSGLKQFSKLSYDWMLKPSLLLSLLKRTWYAGLVNYAYSNNTEIRDFDRIRQENKIKDFVDADQKLFHYAQESLVEKLHQNLPNLNAGGEMSIIRHEASKKRRHLPIRKLISQAGRAIQQIKPVFMMGPMSVATYLKQGAVEFDLVIFDEASQIKVIDSLGAILRGKQVIVVGDTKQMPPSDFFGKSLVLDDEEAEQSQTADVESILGMFLSKGAEETMLRWHYRSRHDSLISVSNNEFYDGKLMIFPSPGVHTEAKGLSHHYLPDALYEQGLSSTNPIEARTIAEMVFKHLKDTPHLTLGVVAFSTKQRDCIILEVERLRREYPENEAFFSTNNKEAFFVKNLENVQGDERDVIMISMGYGKTTAGKMSQNFPLINREGGERRFNVLITRARLSMEVFSNFKSDDILSKADTPFGVKALKNFLTFAETGVLETTSETGRDTDSPFEDEVLKAIKQLGYQVEPQVGAAGFYIDMAVRDTNKPGRYILAVECDGASYHSSATARDRDRLRQAVLEGLGWRFHRIWSTDWFRNPNKETLRLKESIEKSLNYYEQLDANIIISAKQTAVKTAPIISRSSEVTAVSLINIAYSVFDGDLDLPAWNDIGDLDIPRIASSLNKIVNHEGPLHIKEAARRITEYSGFSKVGSRILKRITEAAEHSTRLDLLHFENDFIYKDSCKFTLIRDRSHFSATHKKIEFIPPQEFKKALETVVKNAFSINRDEAVSEAMGLMGFKRATEKAKLVFEEPIQSSISSMKMGLNGNTLIWLDKKL